MMSRTMSGQPKYALKLIALNHSEKMTDALNEAIQDLVQRTLASVYVVSQSQDEDGIYYTLRIGVEG